MTRWAARAGAAVAAAAVVAACSSGRPVGRVAGQAGQAPGPASTGAAASAGTAPAEAAGSATGPTVPAVTSTVAPASHPAPVPVAALPAVPGTPADLGAALASAEASIRDPSTPLGSVPLVGQTEQRLVAALAAHPAWVAGVVASLPAPARAAVSDAVAADTELSAVPGPTPTAIPAWTIVAPRPADELLADYQRTQAATGVPWTVLAAINLVETRMGRIVGPSSAGAQGPMQFLPSTWAEYGAGGDIHDASDAIAAAGRFLRANGARRDLYAAVYRYNPSTHYVRGVLAFAAAMAADARAYYAFYGWRVYVTTAAGTFLLPEGFAQAS